MSASPSAPTATATAAVATVDARIHPSKGMDVLARSEVARLRDASRGGLHALLKSCALAVLASGRFGDDPRAPHALYPSFDIKVEQDDRGLSLMLSKAPAEAFVDGEMIRGVNQLLFAVVRDIVYVGTQIEEGRFDLTSSAGVTEAVFEILRNARSLQAGVEPNLIVCWGGHSIPRPEYEYTKRVGYALGLRGLDVCTGCGPGAMKGPMKGAAIGHAKQRRNANRYIGVTEPGIIAAEPPNPIVNQLVIMPDIEKRLEAFVRLAHGIIVFPGGVGTTEEILYLLGVLLHPSNRDARMPLIFTGPDSAVEYFAGIDRFIRATLGDDAASLYQVVTGDPQAVGRALAAGVADVRHYRRQTRDAFFFNWNLTIEHGYQLPFEPTHHNIASLDLDSARPAHELAADLRRIFSAIVAGNLKDQGMREIERHGPYVIRGQGQIMQEMDSLLKSFVDQQRMKLPGSAYEPCYRLESA